MPRKSKEQIKAEQSEENFQRIAQDKTRDHRIPVAGVIRQAARQYDSRDWRVLRGNEDEFQGIRVFAPVDPLTQEQRQELRSAMSNPYVYRATRNHVALTCGQGYTTSVVPRTEEELPEEQEEAWATSTQIPVPYWSNKNYTPETIKDWVDKKVKKMKMAWNIVNGEFVALEQGRCALGLTPLNKDENDKWQMPTGIRLIRTEFTMRPLLNNNTGELEAVYAVGVETNNKKQNAIPAERLVYIMHAFNNELFSDYYGDSLVARISDIANAFNVILMQDIPNASKNTWSKPGAWVIPIPPQEFGNEQTLVTNFANKINEGEGKTVVVTGPSNSEDIPPTFIPGDKFGDMNGLEIASVRLIKAIITAFGMPGFMISEGDVGALGSNSWLEQTDGYLNIELGPERDMLDEVVETQIYDRILCVLFDTEDYDKIPIKIKHKFNKPALVTLLPPEMYQQLLDMLARGLIDEQGLRDRLGVTQLDRETMSTGANESPADNTAWPTQMRTPIQVNVWPGQDGSLQSTTSSWGAMPKGWEQNKNGWNNTTNKGKNTTWGNKTPTGSKEDGWTR